MKIRNIASIIFMSILFVFIVSCDKKGGSSSASDSISYLTVGEGEWVIKIDDTKIPSDAFDKDLKAFMKLNGQPEDQIALAINDNNTKQAYAEKIISDVLLLQKAEEEMFFESEEAMAIMDAALRNIKIQYYTQQLMAEASKNIPDPTEAQARAFFDQAKAQIAQAYGITEFSTQTRPAINQLYKMAFAEQAIQRQIVDLKDKSIVERNNEILGVPSLIPQQGLGQQTQQEILPRGNN